MAWASLLLGAVSAGINVLLTLRVYFGSVAEHGPMKTWQYSYDSGQFIGAFWMMSLLPAVAGLILGIWPMVRWREKTRKELTVATVGMVLSLSPLLTLMVISLYEKLA